MMCGHLVSFGWRVLFMKSNLYVPTCDQGTTGSVIFSGSLMVWCSLFLDLIQIMRLLRLVYWKIGMCIPYVFVYVTGHDTLIFIHARVSLPWSF